MYSSVELARWVGGAWEKQSDEFSVAGLSHDTRRLAAGEVYIAIRGASYDGHAFVKQAVAQGAVGAIVEETIDSLHIPQLVVPDARVALWQIAAGVRAEWDGAVIGVTGSAGKTTVKEMIAAILSQEGVVSKTIGNWNNELGLPLSMIAADRRSDFFVFELGMNHPGEIDLLASLLRPDWALITNIGKAHVGSFQSDEEPGVDESIALSRIAEEKASILTHARQAVLDPHSEWFERLTRSFDGAVVPLSSRRFEVAQPGAHMAENARFAATLSLALGVSERSVRAGLSAFEPAPMRWERHECAGVSWINDAYNANPLSMRAAISTFADLACRGRKFLVLGGMRELGPRAALEHHQLDEFVRQFHFDRVIAVGDQLAGGVDKERAIEQLRGELRAGDCVLLKASRGERLETIFEALRPDEL